MFGGIARPLYIYSARFSARLHRLARTATAASQTSRFGTFYVRLHSTFTPKVATFLWFRWFHLLCEPPVHIVGEIFAPPDAPDMYGYGARQNLGLGNYSRSYSKLGLSCKRMRSTLHEGVSSMALMPF